jgi:glycosyltransferase involved in cell wall biosynthesis
LINFGGNKGEEKLYGFRNISMGYIKDSRHIAELYSSADCVVIPSMVESFGQVAAEALSCCTPVVSFYTSGLRDIVRHRYNGFIAEAFSPDSLCEQLLEIIKISKKSRLRMGKNGRKHILEKFSYPIIKKMYINILQDAITLKESPRQ